MAIVYRKNSEIDKEKWDKCIDHSVNGMIYGYSFYLDSMSKNWDGLIMDDYQMVMPVTWNRKYGIYYLYQPFFTASLGVFGNHLSAEIVSSFLENIPSRFRYWDIYLNHGNVFEVASFPIYLRMNYILNLEKSYDELIKSYAANHIRNIKRAEHLGCTLKKDIPVEEVVMLAKDQSKQFSPIKDKDYHNFISLFGQLKQKNEAVTYGVYNKNLQLMASCVFFFSHKRAYYIMVGNHPHGRTMGASHYMIDGFIKDHAGDKLFLDFEGSEIRNLAWFYKSFGATSEKYSAIRLNRLPAIIKLLKQ